MYVALRAIQKYKKVIKIDGEIGRYLKNLHKNQSRSFIPKKLYILSVYLHVNVYLKKTYLLVKNCSVGLSKDWNWMGLIQRIMN